MLATLLIAGVTFSFIGSLEAEIIVPDDYLSIQEAINAANPGDTIYVRAGSYYENVIVNKTLSIIGEESDTTIVDGGGTGKVFTITQDNVNITDFTIQGGGSMVSDAGVYLVNVRRCNIFGNKIIDNNYGILLFGSRRIKISGNNITDNATGIGLDQSSENTISGNNVTLAAQGVWLFAISSANNISGNTFKYNWMSIWIADLSGGTNVLEN